MMVEVATAVDLIVTARAVVNVLNVVPVVCRKSQVANTELFGTSVMVATGWMMNTSVLGGSCDDGIKIGVAWSFGIRLPTGAEDG